MGLANVCEACQKNLHGACANHDACVCAMRGHPQIQRPNAARNE